jgi:hypothetical protein
MLWGNLGPDIKEIAMRQIFVAAVALPLLIVPALAHHGWGSYDATKPLTISATIDAVTIGNPHGDLRLSFEGEMWHVTLAPLSRMNARGATAEIVKQGASITAHGYPKRDGTKEMRAEWIEIDGKRYPLR